MENKELRIFKILIHKQSGHYGNVNQWGSISESAFPQLHHHRETLEHLRSEAKKMQTLMPVVTFDHSLVSDIFKDDYILEEFVLIPKAEYERLKGENK